MVGPQTLTQVNNGTQLFIKYIFLNSGQPARGTDGMKVLTASALGPSKVKNWGRRYPGVGSADAGDVDRPEGREFS